MASILQLDPHDSSANPPWLYVKDGQPMVKGSLVPGAKRILTQNSPMTKDYRPDRLNIFYDETSRKITGVTLKNCTSKAEALKILGANAKEESSELRLYCPRNTNYVYATVANDKVVGCGTR
ncbi:hypothetical protein IWW54_005872 [Coemansia sp. RSA 2705]|nr:hypothetical protein IWW54_005872 [Coemansia sp. RSA 2705]